MQSNKPLVIYHGDCLDGFGAAYAFWKMFKNQFEYHPGYYGHPVPDVADRDVYLVDFSYPRDIIEGMIRFANSVTLIDHHKTAIEALADVENLSRFTDVNRSGAVLAWHYLQDNFYQDQPVPQLMRHIQDRDLWKFELEGTEEITKGLYNEDFSFKIWDDLVSMGDSGLKFLHQAGKFILQKDNKEIARIAKNSWTADFETYAVPVVNSVQYASELGNLLSKNRPFAVVYYDTMHERKFSLRSQKDHGIDVSMIAKLHGGGGHKNAAGFSVPKGHYLADL